MSMRGAVTGCLVLVCLVALQAERTEGHIPFFSPKEMIEMKGREGRKDMAPRSELEDGPFVEVTERQHLPQVEHGGNTDKTVEISVRLSPEQLESVAPVLEKIVHEVGQHQKAK